MDTLQLHFICQQCGKQITLSFRQIAKGKPAACPSCGPNKLKPID